MVTEREIIIWWYLATHSECDGYWCRKTHSACSCLTDMPRLSTSRSKALRAWSSVGKVAVPPEKSGLQRGLALLPPPPESAAAAEVFEGFTLMPRRVLQQLSKCLHCFECGSDDCSLEMQPHSIDAGIDVRCKLCAALLLSSRADCVMGLDGNRSEFTEGHVRLVCDRILNGGGFAGLSHTCDRVALPSLNSKRYAKHATFLQVNMNSFYMELSARILPAVYRHYEYVDDGSSLPVDVAVSFDGTWMTRGHQSHIGAAFVIV